MKKSFHITVAVLISGAIAINVLARNTRSEIARNLQTFNEIYKEVQLNYVDTIDPTTTMRTAIDAMLQQIDPYTEYYASNEQEEILSVSSGEYAGIGSSIMKRDTLIVLAEPRWGSPARLAGVKHGDIILAINNEWLTKDITTSQASSKLRGQPGTELTLTVRRPYVSDSIKTIHITRSTIAIAPLDYYGILDGGVGYIKVTTFNDKTAGAFAHALGELRRDGRMKSLIIDLRDNGGGLLESAVQLVGNFVPKNTKVVETVGRDPRQKKTYKTTHSPIDVNIPLAVLIDGGTASSAEIVAGALQDLDRAVIIGSRSYGKGLVQNVRPLPYNALIKITTGRYYIPSGRLIQAIVYKHDGDASDNASRIPDSLTTIFHTAGGREVRDGGGITPDSTITNPELSRLEYKLIAENWIDDYANRFVNTRDITPDATTWQLPDSTFDDFVAKLDRKRFKYDLPYEKGIEYLRDAAKIEGYLNDSLTAELDKLSAMLKPNLDRDLDNHRADILKVLRYSIDRRYFSDSDVNRRSLTGDSVLTTAITILSDPLKYKAILAPKVKSDKNTNAKNNKNTGKR